MRVCRAIPLTPGLAGFLVAVLIAVPTLSAPNGNSPASIPILPVKPVPGSGPGGTAPDDRLRAIVGLVEQTRLRAGMPGMRDEERDALSELAWAQIDEALDDPLLRERSLRSPAFLQVQALLLMDDGEDEEAIIVLERLRTIAPADPETHRLFGLAFMGLGNAQGAIEAYRRALAHGGSDAAQVRAHLAYALALAGRHEEGLAESDRAIAEGPAEYLGHFTRGWILGELDRREEERREYLEAVKLERDDADLWALLARSWERDGDNARALAAWREVARIDPSDEDAAEKLGVKR